MDVEGSVEDRTEGSVEGGRATRILWLESGGCEGCTMSVLGATAPRLENLLDGPATDREIELVHPLLAVGAGEELLSTLREAAAGNLDPFLLVLEGSLFDEARAGHGTFSALGVEGGRPVTVRRWVERLAPRAAAVLAIGTCATAGGIPAAEGSVTGASSLEACLGEGFRSRGDLPVVNVPGCAPSGDAFVEVLMYVLLHLDGQVPLDLDVEHRPRWLYSTETPVVPPSGRRPPSDAPRLEAACPVPARGWINRLGGCEAVGGACVGCTRSDFPDGPLALARSGS